MRLRLDAALVRRGLASSRSEAARLIGSGVVTVGGSFADKAARLVHPGDPIEVLAPSRFVSRGGEKLDAALTGFGIDVSGRSVMDVGASTGGFTDCVLHRGARRVFALDVGSNQLHERLAADPRVVSRERTNVRSFPASDMPFPCSLVVADLSFISLAKVASRLVEFVSDEVPHDGGPTDATSGGRVFRSTLVVLVKPQFEAGRTVVSRGRGVVSDPVVHDQVIREVTRVFEGIGTRVEGVIESPIRGASGNTEFLMLVDAADRS